VRTPRLLSFSFPFLLRFFCSAGEAQIYDFKVRDIDLKEVDLKKYKGKVSLHILCHINSKKKKKLTPKQNKSKKGIDYRERGVLL
jgi:glutathione peroxidase-family protein